MKNISTYALRHAPVAAVLGLLMQNFVASAQGDADYVRYKAKPIGSTVRIDGNANIHEWTMEGTIISGYVEVPAGITLDSSQAGVPGSRDGKVAMKAEVRIPVTSVKNGRWDGMNEIMQDAMKAKSYPGIDYHLSDFYIKLPHSADTPYQCDAKGELSLHGVTNNISMAVSIETVDKTKLKIVGTGISIKMTDYGIQPPAKAGVFKTDDEVKISFEFIAGQYPKTAAK